MKKIYLALCCTLLLTGCGKTLNCSIEEEFDNTKTKMNYKFSYSSDGSELEKIESVRELTVVDGEEEKLGNADEMKKSLQEERPYAKFDVNIKDKTLTTKMQINVKKLKDEEKEHLGINVKMNYDDMKLELENTGYSCK